MKRLRQLPLHLPAVPVRRSRSAEISLPAPSPTVAPDGPHPNRYFHFHAHCSHLGPLAAGWVDRSSAVAVAAAVAAAAALAHPLMSSGALQSGGRNRRGSSFADRTQSIPPLSTVSSSLTTIYYCCHCVVWVTALTRSMRTARRWFYCRMVCIVGRIVYPLSRVQDMHALQELF